MRSMASAAAFALLVSGSAVQAADYAGYGRHHVRHRHGPRAAIGQCVRTRVADLLGEPGNATPTSIRYTDGVIQAYDSDMPGHIETHRGDPIKLCLVAFTRDCGDDDFLPGRTYATGNLRTGAAWTLPDVRSSCQAR